MSLKRMKSAKKPLIHSPSVLDVHDVWQKGVENIFVGQTSKRTKQMKNKKEASERQP